jgi:hypothetical protein
LRYERLPFLESIGVGAVLVATVVLERLDELLL